MKCSRFFTTKNTCPIITNNIWLTIIILSHIVGQKYKVLINKHNDYTPGTPDCMHQHNSILGKNFWLSYFDIAVQNNYIKT